MSKTYDDYAALPVRKLKKEILELHRQLVGPQATNDYHECSEINWQLHLAYSALDDLTGRAR